MSGISNAILIAAGDSHTCALLPDGTVDCWGLNDSGELANGTVHNSSTPVQVNGISNAILIAASNFHTCALLFGGTIECWGWNGDGQLGNGESGSSSYEVSPVQVNGISDATWISAGDLHTCALLPGGASKCWGANVYGQLGNGTTTDSSTPVDVIGIP